MDTNNLSQILMFLNLNNFLKNYNFQNIIPLLVIFYPIFNSFYDFIKTYFLIIYNNKDENLVSLKYPVHEIKLCKDNYNSNSAFRLIYSLTYLSINDYIVNNLDIIDGVKNLIEILNTDINYFSNDAVDKNFFLIPTDDNEILIDKINEIYCKIISIKKKNDDKNDSSNKNNDSITKYELLLYIKCKKNISNEEYKKNLIKIQNFKNNCKKIYEKKKINNDDDKHYLYEYIGCVKDELEINLKFIKYIFKNNKNLDTNIFFDNKEKLLNFINKFKYNKNIEANEYENEYNRVGCTYKAIIMLDGPPGCGKTSAIKGILNKTERIPIQIDMSKIRSNEELQKVFRNRKINGVEYSNQQLCFIFEDCDAYKNNFLFSRKDKIIDSEISSDLDEISNSTILLENNQIDNKKYKTNNINNLLKDYNLYNKTFVKEDELNLGCLLNILDGINELHGLMVIFTSNHPEKLDEAFLRPGRIDYKITFKRATVDIIKQIIKNKFITQNNYDLSNCKFIDYVLSPAEVQSICFQSDSLEECIILLEKETIKYISRLN